MDGLVGRLAHADALPNIAYAIGLASTTLPNRRGARALDRHERAISSWVQARLGDEVARTGADPRLAWCILATCTRLLSTHPDRFSALHDAALAFARDCVVNDDCNADLVVKSVQHLSQAVSFMPARASSDYIDPPVVHGLLRRLHTGAFQGAIGDIAECLGKIVDLTVGPASSPADALLFPADDNDDDDDREPLHLARYASEFASYPALLDALDAVLDTRVDAAVLSCFAALSPACIARCVAFVGDRIREERRPTDWLRCLADIVARAHHHHHHPALSAPVVALLVEQTPRLSSSSSSVRDALVDCYRSWLQHCPIARDDLAAFVDDTLPVVQDPLVVSDVVYALRAHDVDLAERHVADLVASLRSGACSDRVLAAVCEALGRVACFAPGRVPVGVVLDALEACPCSPAQVVAVVRVALNADGEDCASCASRLVHVLCQIALGDFDVANQDDDDDDHEADVDLDADMQYAAMAMLEIVIGRVDVVDVALLAAFVDDLLEMIAAPAVFEDDAFVQVAGVSLIRAIAERSTFGSSFNWDKIGNRLRAADVDVVDDDSRAVIQDCLQRIDALANVR